MNLTHPRHRRWRPVSLLLAPLLAGAVLVSPGSTAQAADLEPLVTTAGTTWTYLENDTDPAGTSADTLVWTKDGFDDSAWKSAKGSFGAKVSGSVNSPVYDSTHTATTLLESNSPGTSNRVRTYFFRTSFDLTSEELTSIDRLEGLVESDDGIVVYVNGAEVLRNDVPAGSPNLAYADVNDTDLDTNDFTIDDELLKAGRNTVAVAVHNQRASSSDIWFDMTHLTPKAGAVQGPQPSRVILTPTETPETSQNITWQGSTEASTSAKVQIRPTAGGSARTVKGYEQEKAVNNAFPHFSATVTGLKPATEYSYRVASGTDWSDWFDFETADPAEKEFDYIYYGDAQIGLDTTWPEVVRQAQEKAPDAIGSVHAGDLIDTASNDTQWKNWFKGMETAGATTNVMAAPGNHEYSGDKKLTAWKAHFEYPLNQPADDTIGDMAKLAEGDTPVAKQYRAYFDHWAEFAAETVYFTDYQGVRFITINATRDTAFLTPDGLPACSGAECPSTKVAALWTQYQAEWLDHILGESPSKWNVVTFHQPVYSASSGRNEPVLREYWVPVFEKHDIDLVQMGHDHVYARGYNNANTTETPGITDGPVYIVSNSGAKHYDLETDEKNVWTNNGATQVKKGEDFTTFQVISVSDDALHYRSYLAEKTSTSTTDLHIGAVWDEFTVSKSDAGRKFVTEVGVDVPPLEDPEPEVPETPAPVITTQPAATVAALVGSDVTLEVAVDSESDVSYQWQRQAVAGGDWTNLRGEDEATLTLEEVTAREARYRYRVQVTAGEHTVVSAASRLSLSKRKTSVAIGGTSFKKGRTGAVNVRASQAGTVKVVVKQGTLTRTTYKTVRAGVTTKVKTGTLSKKLTRKVRVTVTLTPTDGATFAAASATKKVTARR